MNRGFKRFRTKSVGFWRVARTGARFISTCLYFAYLYWGAYRDVLLGAVRKRSEGGMDWFCTGCAKPCPQHHRQSRCPGQHAPRFHAASPKAPYVIEAGSTPQSNPWRRFARWRCASCDAETDLPETHACAPKLQNDQPDGRGSASAGSDCERDVEQDNAAFFQCQYGATKCAAFNLHVCR